MSENLQTDVPLVNMPFVDPKTGTVTEAWFIFLIQLWRRTGGGSGQPGTGITLDDVLGVEQTFGQVSLNAFNDVLAASQTFALPAIAPDFDISAERTEAIGSRQEALLEMIFAPPSAGVEIVDNTFTAGVDFNPGVDSALTLSRVFGAIPRLWIYFDGMFQGDDQVASLVGQTLTFTSPIPVGVSKVYVKGLLLG